MVRYEKKSFWGLIIFIGIFSFVIARSFGFWKYDFIQNNKNNGITTCFQISYEEKSSAITLEKAIPISDEEGKLLLPYTFVITNTCPDPAGYQVNLENIQHEFKSFPLEYIKVELDENTPNILTSYKKVKPYLNQASEAYKLTSGTLAGKSSVEYDLRLWIDSETPANEQTSEASFLSKISVVATPTTEEEVANDIDIAIIYPQTNYNIESEKVIIQATSRSGNFVDYSFSNTIVSDYSLLAWNSILPETDHYEISKTYNQNGEYYVYFRDERGNIQEKRIEISKIDREGPEIIEAIVSEEWGIENTITVKAIDSKSGIVGYALTEIAKEPENYQEVSGTTAEQIFTSKVNRNGIYYIWLKDYLGNVCSKEIEVNKIDDVAPVLSDIINSSMGQWANNITLSWTIEEKETGIGKVQVSNDQEIWNDLDESEWTGFTRNNSSNEKIYIRVIDKAGNISEVKETIMKIDVTPPSSSFAIESSTVGSNGWYQALSIKVTGDDTESGIASAKYCTTTSTTCTPNTVAALSNNTFSLGLKSNASAQRMCVRVIDQVGNASSINCSNAYLVDVNNPIAKITTSVSGNSITISASGSSDVDSGIVKIIVHGIHRHRRLIHLQDYPMVSIHYM